MKPRITRKQASSRTLMWTCPVCGHRFANRNQWHGCGDYSVSQHFAGKPVKLRKLFNAFLRIVRKNGPVRLHPTKTRIGLIARMTFAAATPGKDCLRAHLILPRRVDLPRFHRIEQYSPRCFGHYFTIRSLDDLDDLKILVAEAYRLGKQEQLLSMGEALA